MNKTLILISTLVFSAGAMAHNHDGDKAQKIADKKVMITANIDKRIDSLNQMKTCISAAQDRSGIKECRKANKARMSQLKMDRKAMKNK